jgi:hypothetical protein
MVTTIKKRKNQYFILSLIVILSLFCSINVYAEFGNHVNVSILEQVYQETSYAENYTLVEWQKSCYSEGTINVTNQNNETVYDLYISFLNTASLSDNLSHDSTTKFGNQTQGQPGQKIVIHIPELRQFNYSVFTYNISCMGINPPVNIETSYENTDHGFNAKVLSGYNWTINQTIINNNPTNLTITNINITMKTANVTWNDTNYNFYFGGLYPGGDAGNVAELSTVDWWWTPNTGQLDWLKNESIKYNLTAPLSVPFTATYLALRESVTFQVNYLLSNLTIDEINASAKIDIDFEKKIIRPADNIENHNVTWEITPEVKVPVNITYDLTKVAIWVTENLDPTNTTSNTNWGYLGVNYTGSPIEQINMSNSWGNSSYVWRFNYTDGANAANPPPIVWMKPEYLIANQWGQIYNYTQSIAGNDVYLKYIYVIHGYWLEVSKNVSNIGEDQYRIDILVENIGNGWTPEFEKVTVYDFIPEEFAEWDMQPASYSCLLGASACTNLSIGTSGDEFYGMSYRWDIEWKGTMNSSLGPKKGPNAVSVGNYSWNVSYKVNGTGPYRVTDLYIVGLDPLKVDGAFASPIITIISGIQSYTNEIIYLSVIAFLIIINITNLVMTNRIHRKIQQRLPPAPMKQHNHHKHNHHNQ